ncbi:hypothetical protein RI367_001544 [Sorochytrium milnesiophthora]
MQQGANKTVTQYADCFHGCRAATTADDASAANTFITGLRLRLQHHVIAQGARTFEKATKLATLLEQAGQASKHNSVVPTVPIADPDRMDLSAMNRGASSSFIRGDIVERLSPAPLRIPRKLRVTLGNGQEVATSNAICAKIQTNDTVMRTRFTELKTEASDKAQQLLKDYSNIFAAELTKLPPPRDYDHRISLTTDQAVRRPLFRYSPREQEEL